MRKIFQAVGLISQVGTGQEGESRLGQQVTERPLISVIVPVYNGQGTIERCIESIEGQSYPNLEVIIVNDGSKDATGEVCERLALTHGNIRVLTLGDEGVSAARNAGIDAARGEYIAFVDADDRLLADTLGVLYESIRETGSDIAGCGFFMWKEETEFEEAAGRAAGIGKKETVFIEKQVFTAEDFLRDGILKGNSRCWSKLYRRSAIGRLRFRKGLTIGEDMLFLVDMLPEIGKVAESAYPGYGYYQNPAGAMNREFQPEYMDQITCWEIARESIANRGPVEDKTDRRELAGKDAGNRERAEGCGSLEKEEYSQVTAILIMSIMLTAGKLALLSGKERKGQREYIRICRDKIKKELQAPGAYERLSVGYKVKAKLFAAVPGVYLWLYHLKKMGK